MIGSQAPYTPKPQLVGTEALYVSGDDHLLVTTLNAAAGVTLTIGGRSLRDNGSIHVFQERHVPNTDRTAATTVIRLPCGWLQNLTIVASGGTPLYGQTFVRVDLFRGDNTGRTSLATLVQGMLTAQQRLAWPGSPLTSTHERPGGIRSITGTNPAAGVEISETVPTGARWRVLGLVFTLVTDATVANRDVNVLIDDGTNTLLQLGAGSSQTASTSRLHTLINSGANPGILTSATPVLGTIPFLLLAGYRIRTSTVNLQAGDNYGAPQLLVEEWLEGN